MGGESDEELGYLIANLCVFYKGSVTYKELNEMPLPELYDLYRYSQRINRDTENELRKQRSR
jgi:hypothetical protein